MDEADAQPLEETPELAADEPAPRRSRIGLSVLGAVLGVSALALGAAWLARESIADKVVIRHNHILRIICTGHMLQCANGQNHFCASRSRDRVV